VCGIILRWSLPQTHLSVDSNNAVSKGMNLVATMAALVLGLLVSSAKTFYDSQSTELTEMSAKIILLDRMLADYGPETNEVRNVLRDIVADSINRTWPQERAGASKLVAPSKEPEVLIAKIRRLSPKDESHRALQGQALNIGTCLIQTRWLMYEQQSNSVSKPMLVILVFWLTAIFISYGLFTPGNATARTVLFVAALSVSGAIFLILEMYAPFGGLIEISSGPLRAVIAQLGR